MSNKQLPADVQQQFPITWEYKSHSYQIADTGDYDGYWEITNGKDSIITREDYEDIEKDLQAVVDLLNNTYANFTVDRDNEAALDAENKFLRQEIEELKKTQLGPVWVKASEFKTIANVFRPYRRKSIHEGCDYDFGEIFITLNEDDDLLYLDIDNEDDYLPQSDERWNDFEILDESGAAANELHLRYHEEREQRVHLEKENDIITGRCNELKAKGDTVAMWLRRLRGSLMAHPDYHPGDNSEFNDMVSGCNEALAEWKGEKEPVKGGMPKLEDGPLLDDEDMKAWEELQNEEKQSASVVVIIAGLKFRNIHMRDYSFEVINVAPGNNTLSVRITSPSGEDFWTEPDWILQHTQWAFEKGEYFIEKEVKGEKGN